VARTIIDTNVVLSFLLVREPRQQAQATELFTAAARGEHELAVHQIVISETVYVLTNVYAVGRKETAAIIRDLLATPGVVPLNDLTWATLLDVWPDRVDDFGDACLAAVATTGAVDSVATFDARFARQLRRLDLPTYWR